MKANKKAKLNKVLNLYIGIGVTLWIVAGVLILTPIFPQIWYQLFPNTYTNERSSLTTAIETDVNKLDEIRQHYSEPEPSPEPEPEEKLPPFNASLSKTPTIKISKIGVTSPIYLGADWNAALNQGPWMVNDFGTPDNQFAPIIIASHRWGGIGWDVNKRNQRSFLKLPDVVYGDVITIVWGQREYKYQVYRGDENTKIDDYNADLILYTCKLYWESPIRIFRYARRIN
ncbi:MAG: hypothetical protein Fur003_2610 [Candidatus Dojkabacteria bacterium]